MPKIRLVTEQDGAFAFRCPYPLGCGVETDDGHVPWSSTNWPSRELAVERGKQHLREHETGADPDVETEVMPSLEEFRKANGLAGEPQTVNPDDWEF